MIRLILLTLCVYTGSALAHEVRPAYLEINATGDSAYSVVWKQPLLNGRPLSLQPDFPRDCVRSSSRIEALGTDASSAKNSCFCVLRSQRDTVQLRHPSHSPHEVV